MTGSSPNWTAQMVQAASLPVTPLFCSLFSLDVCIKYCWVYDYISVRTYRHISIYIDLWCAAYIYIYNLNADVIWIPKRVQSYYDTQVYWVYWCIHVISCNIWCNWVSNSWRGDPARLYRFVIGCSPRCCTRGHETGVAGRTCFQHMGCPQVGGWPWFFWTPMHPCIHLEPLRLRVSMDRQMLNPNGDGSRASWSKIGMLHVVHKEDIPRHLLCYILPLDEIHLFTCDGISKIIGGTDRLIPPISNSYKICTHFDRWLWPVLCLAFSPGIANRMSTTMSAWKTPVCSWWDARWTRWTNQFKGTKVVSPFNRSW